MSNIPEPTAPTDKPPYLNRRRRHHRRQNNPDCIGLLEHAMSDLDALFGGCEFAEADGEKLIEWIRMRMRTKGGHHGQEKAMA